MLKEFDGGFEHWRGSRQGQKYGGISRNNGKVWGKNMGVLYKV
jgi:hypothetical protein